MRMLEEITGGLHSTLALLGLDFVVIIRVPLRKAAHREQGVKAGASSRSTN